MKEYWLFGYGSLIWKPPPHTVERIPGYIKGNVRRFWQSSIDHRGTPEAPGRVVTLISRDYWQTLDDPHPYGADDVVWGVAYRIDPQYAVEVKKYLDYREKNGYTDETVQFYAADTERTQKSWNCIVYIGTPQNPAFVGPEQPDVLAKLIATREGPSGPNSEYLFELDAALRELRPEGELDPHISDLTKRVRILKSKTNDL